MDLRDEISYVHSAFYDMIIILEDISHPIITTPTQINDVNELYVEL